MGNAELGGDVARVVNVLAGAFSSAAVVEESTPPDMATTTLVSCGRPSRSRLLRIVPAKIASAAVPHVPLPVRVGPPPAEQFGSTRSACPVESG
jgi:hypothetical protein